MSQPESEDTDTDQQEVSHILIRRATSLDSFHRLYDPTSVESSVARSRGGGSLVDTEETGTDSTPDSQDSDSDSDTNGQSQWRMDLKEGRISIDTNYVMHFVERSERHLTVYDIAALPEKTAYPVSRDTLRTLDHWALSRLHSDGHIKLTGVYDRDTKQFLDVEEGWTEYRNPYDEIAELAKKADGDFLSVIYYLLSEHASDQYAYPESIAEIRGIEPSTVKNGINKVADLDTGKYLDDL